MDVPKLLRTALFSVLTLFVAGGLMATSVEAQTVTVNEDDGETIAQGLSDLDAQEDGDGAATLEIVAGDYTNDGSTAGINVSNGGTVSNITDLTIQASRDDVDGVDQLTIESLDINAAGSVTNVDLTSDGNGFVFVESGNDDETGVSNDLDLQGGTLDIQSANLLRFQDPANSTANTTSDLKVRRASGEITSGAPTYNGNINEIEYVADGDDISAGSELGTASLSTADVTLVETLVINDGGAGNTDLVSFDVQSFDVGTYTQNTDNVEVSGNFNVGSEINESGGDLTVGTDASPANLTVSGNGIVGVGGDLTVNGTLDAEGAVGNSNGALTVDGDLNADGDVTNSGGALTVGGEIEIDGGVLTASNNVNGADEGSPSDAGSLVFTDSGNDGVVDRGSQSGNLVDAGGNTVVFSDVTAELGVNTGGSQSDIITDGGEAIVQIDDLTLNATNDGDDDNDDITETVSANNSNSEFLINDVDVPGTETSNGSGTDAALVDITNVGTFTVAGDLNAVDNSGSSNTLTLNAQPDGSNTALTGQLDNSGSSNDGTVTVAGNVDYDLVAAGGSSGNDGSGSLGLNGAIDNSANGLLEIESGTEFEIDVGGDAGVVTSNTVPGGDVLSNNGPNSSGVNVGVSGGGTLSIVSSADGGNSNTFTVRTRDGDPNNLDVDVTTDVAIDIEDSSTGDKTDITVGDLTTTTDGSAQNGAITFADGVPGTSPGIGAVTTGAITAGGSVTFGSDGNVVGDVTTGAITADAAVTFGDGGGVGAITTGDVTANANVSFGEDGDVGAIDTGALTANSGTVSFGSDSGSDESVASGSEITPDNITADGGNVEVQATGTVGALSTSFIRANEGTIDLSNITPAQTTTTLSNAADANVQVSGSFTSSDGSEVSIDVNESASGTSLNIEDVEVHATRDLMRDGTPSAEIVTNGSSVLRFIGAENSEFDTGSRFTIEGDLISEKSDARTALTGAVSLTGDLTIAEASLGNTNELELQENLFLTGSAATVTLNGIFTTDSGNFLVVNGNSKTIERTAGSATLPNIRVNEDPATDANGTSDAVTIASDLEFDGNVQLQDGGITIDRNAGTTAPSSIDFAPTGSGSEITRFLDGQNTEITEADGSSLFNDPTQSEYDLTYDANSPTATDVGAELTDNVRNLDVNEDATPQLDENGVTLSSGALTVESGAGISDDSDDDGTGTITVELASAETHTINGAIKGVNNSNPNPITVDVTAGDAGVTEIQGDASDSNDRVDIGDGNGSTVTLSGSSVENLESSAENVSVTDLQQVNGTVEVGTDASLDLGLAASDESAGNDTDQTINDDGNTTANGAGLEFDGNLTLSSDASVTNNGITATDGELALGDNDLEVTGGDFSADETVSYSFTNAANSASRGELVLNSGGGVSTGNNDGNDTGDAPADIPNVRVEANGTTLNSDVGVANRLVVNAGENGTNGIDLNDGTSRALSASGFVVLNGESSSSSTPPDPVGGSGTFDVSDAEIRLADGGNSSTTLNDGVPNQRVSTLTVSGGNDVSVVSTGSSARELKVNGTLDIATDAGGAFALGTNDVEVDGFTATDVGDDASVTSGEGGFLQFDELQTALNRAASIDRLQVVGSSGSLLDDGDEQTLTVNERLRLDAPFDATDSGSDTDGSEELAIGAGATIERTEGASGPSALAEPPTFNGDVNLEYSAADGTLSGVGTGFVTGSEVPSSGDATVTNLTIDVDANNNGFVDFRETNTGSNFDDATGTVDVSSVDLKSGFLVQNLDGQGNSRQLSLTGTDPVFAQQNGEIPDEVDLINSGTNSGTINDVTGTGTNLSSIEATDYTLRYDTNNDGNDVTISDEEYSGDGNVSELVFADPEENGQSATADNLNLGSSERTVGALTVDRSDGSSQFDLTSSSTLTVNGETEVASGEVTNGTLNSDGTGGTLGADSDSDVLIGGTLSSDLEAEGNVEIDGGSLSGSTTLNGQGDQSFDGSSATVDASALTLDQSPPSSGDASTVSVNDGNGTLDLSGDLNLNGGVLVADEVQLENNGLNRDPEAGQSGNNEFSHVAAALERTVETGTGSAGVERVNFPVGTENPEFRRYRLDFPDGAPVETDITIEYREEQPDGTNGLPTTDNTGVTIGTAIPAFQWRISSDEDLTLDPGEYQATVRTEEEDLALNDPVGDHRLIVRDQADDPSNAPYEIVGTGDTYSNSGPTDGEISIRSEGAGADITELGTVFTIGVPAGDAPQIATNSGLAVTQGESGAIGQGDLETTDADDDPADLTYTVTDGPSQGEIQVGGSQATTFTQADINNDDVAVVYNHTASNTDNDSFTFEVADPDGNTKQGTFNITVEQGLVAISGSVNYPTEGDGALAAGSELNENFEVDGFEVVATPSSGGDALPAATPEEDGDFTIDGASPGTDYDVTVQVSASVDPGFIDVFDAQRVVTGSIGRVPFVNPLQEEVADVTNDDNITSRDGLAILLNSGDDPFGAGEWATTEQTVEAGTDEEASLQVAQYGDVTLNGGNGGDESSSSTTTLALSESEQSEAATSASASAAASDAASDADVKAEAGKTFEVPVRVEGDASIGAYDLQFSYDEENASFEGASVASGELFTDSEEGAVGVSWLDKTGESPLSASDGSPVVTLSFTAEEGVEEESLGLEVSDGRMTDPSGSTIRGVTLSAPTVSVGAVAPEEFALQGNYPNPVASGQATIEMDLPSNGSVTVEVYNTLGQQVMSTSQSMRAGSGQTVKVDGSQLSSGQYFYRVEANLEGSTVRETGRMTVVR